jgi:hypothetical protein
MWRTKSVRAGGMAAMLGAGETELEKQRRTVGNREVKIKAELKLIEQQRAATRERRSTRSLPVVALLGYTNAGKTALHSRLTARSDSNYVDKSEDKLFATLDTTARVGTLDSGLRAVFIDTVGFISQLPHELVQSFRSTLADSLAADLLLHVRDVSHPASGAQCNDVHEVLRTLQVSPKLLDSHLEIWNKIDRRPDLWTQLQQQQQQQTQQQPPTSPHPQRSAAPASSPPQPVSANIAPKTRSKRSVKSSPPSVVASAASIPSVLPLSSADMTALMTPSVSSTLHRSLAACFPSSPASKSSIAAAAAAATVTSAPPVIPTRALTPPVTSLTPIDDPIVPAHDASEAVGTGLLVPTSPEATALVNLLGLLASEHAVTIVQDVACA